jgi:hypothetical protein
VLDGNPEPDVVDSVEAELNGAPISTKELVKSMEIKCQYYAKLEIVIL